MSNQISFTEKAFAKVNLTLEILGRRRDGFHNLASVMQTVDLFDTIEFSESNRVNVICDDDEIAPEINLASKAASVLQQQVGITNGATITIKKNIPVSAGLGGGSSDAAAALRGLNKLWNLGLSLDELTEIGAEIGSDVPFLVRGGTALVQGRGEDVTPINPAAVPKFLILTPEVVLEHSTAKTASVFSHVKESMFTRGNLTHKLAARIRAAGDCPPEFFFNQFGTISEELFPGWNKDRDLIMSFGARDVMLCGAGPSMFTIPSSKELGTAWHLLLSTVHRKRSFLVGPAIAISEGLAA
ncbi:MAG: 4-(cytidine 5'-diphospho)-2-C-methyl-D-erythritol kinase [Dehalococcoidia bacterium]|nr:4-(cytidine 5'-diphospho)-2-C-methyl-D-erythritol kinase [Dehalococcoidia bacterium]